MAYSDQVILEALRRQLEHEPHKALSYEEIADASGATYATVRRSIKRLLSSGAVQTVYRHTNGYQYRICDEQCY